MTAQRFIQLHCECGCTGPTRTRHACSRVYPPLPSTEPTVKAVRESARTAGWETMRNTTGRDLCPQCRIAEIQAATADINQLVDEATS